MAIGHSGRFFGQLAFLLRRGLTLRETLDLLASDATGPGWPEAIRRAAGRIDGGESLSAALAELPPPFPRELLPFIEEMEQQGLLQDEAEILMAWPDAGTTDPPALLARIFAHASIRFRRGQPLSEALGRSVSPEDPEFLGAAVRAMSKALILDQSMSEVMGDHPQVFSPGLRRVVLQMERNGDATETFRSLALALARGWFAAGTGMSPKA